MSICPRIKTKSDLDKLYLLVKVDRKGLIGQELMRIWVLTVPALFLLLSSEVPLWPWFSKFSWTSLKDFLKISDSSVYLLLYDNKKPEMFIMTLELSPAYDHPAHALQSTRGIHSGQCGDTDRSLGRQKEHTLCSWMTYLHFLKFLTSLST